MFGDKARWTVDVPVHPKGVQWGWDQKIYAGQFFPDAGDNSPVNFTAAQTEKNNPRSKSTHEKKNNSRKCDCHPNSSNIFAATQLRKMKYPESRWNIITGKCPLFFSKLRQRLHSELPVGFLISDLTLTMPAHFYQHHQGLTSYLRALTETDFSLMLIWWASGACLTD